MEPCASSPWIFPHSEQQPEEFIIAEAKLLPLGRVLSSLLSVNHQDLQFRATSSSGQINKSLQAFLNHAEFTARKGLPLDKLLIPLLQHVVNSRGWSNRRRVSCILDWLFLKIPYNSVADGLVMIIKSKQFDHHTKLGWCMVIRDFLQARTKMRDYNSGALDANLATLISCIPELMSLISKASEKDMPTRLSLMAADCIILLANHVVQTRSSLQAGDGIDELAASNSRLLAEVDRFQGDLICDVASTSGRDKSLVPEEILWGQLDTLIEIVSKLKKWNEKGRVLYARGIQAVELSLKNLVQFRNSLVMQSGGEGDLLVLKTLLSTCWDSYGVLLLSENSTLRSEYKVMLQRWIQGLQNVEMKAMEDQETSLRTSRRVQEISIFFLTCLALLLGRLKDKEMEFVVLEFGPELLHTLLFQLRKAEETLDLAVAIVRYLLFKMKLATNDRLKMETVASSLVDLLDEQDSTSKTVCILIADYLAVNPSFLEFDRLMANLTSGSLVQRQNAISVLSELLHNLSTSEYDTTNAIKQSIAAHLLKCLGDVDLANRLEVSRLFAKIEPNFVVPGLVQQAYSRDDKVRSSACASILSVLKGHSNPCDAVCVLLDCISNMVLKTSAPVHPGHIGNMVAGASTPDMDRIMKLIPSWACEVKEWNPLINMLLEKMLSDPSNPVLPRFLSQISIYLGENADNVFKHVLSFMARQPRKPKDVTTEFGNTNSTESMLIYGASVFERLSPLLILRVLPLKAFDEASSRELYGRYSGTRIGSLDDGLSIVDLLLERACGILEAHEVQKVSAELLGRCLPRIVLPILTTKLEKAVYDRGTSEAKSCLYTVCNLLLLRGKVALDDQFMSQIQSILADILLWPCLPTDEDTFKTQHGCIDCFALMVMVELLSFEGSKDAGTQSLPKKGGHYPMIEEAEEIVTSDSNLQSVLSVVISCTVDHKQGIPFLPDRTWEDAEIAARNITKESPVNVPSIQTAFRLCMANVLIRASQKIPIKQQRIFSIKVLPPLMAFIKHGMESQIKAACLQILFSLVHNLKGEVIDYATDLLELSLEVMKKHTYEEERLGAGRLLAALLTSEDNVTQELAPYLTDVLIVLESITRMDPSVELRSFCDKLLSCLKPSHL